MESTRIGVAGKFGSSVEFDPAAVPIGESLRGIPDCSAKNGVPEKGKQVLKLFAVDEGVVNEPYVGMEFDSADACKEFYNQYAWRTGFSVRIGSTSRSARDRSVIGRYFYCSKEGFRQKRKEKDATQVKNRKVRMATREGCGAKLVIRKDSNGKWVVRMFVKEHNHPMCMPTEVRYLRPNKGSSSMEAQGLIERCIEAGIDTNQMMSCLKKEAARISKLGLLQRDCGSNSTSMKRKTADYHDMQAALDYLKTTQAKNPGFVYVIQVNDEERVSNFFWADGRCSISYKYFGDAVTFTVTLKSNKYKMPFGLFTGLNHHKQIVFFGCGLLSEESEDSYVWLFNVWLEAMKGKHPASITTEQDHAIGAAVSRVFPPSQHVYSVWHILKKADEKLANVYQLHKGLKEELHKSIYTSETVEEFEDRWKCHVVIGEFRENGWVQSQYGIRHQWVPTYVRNAFLMDLSMPERSEAINLVFDGVVKPNTTLQELLCLCKIASDRQYEKELQADFETSSSQAVVKTSSPMEKDAADVFTRTIFKKFQEELVSSLAFTVEEIEKVGVNITYQVTKFVDRSKTYVVKLVVPEARASCNCQLFEHSGILCRHILIAFRMKNILRLPAHYVLRRLTRNAKNAAVGDWSVDNPRVEESLTARFDDICCRGIKLAEDGAASMYLYQNSIGILDKAFEDVVRMKNIYVAN